MEPTQKINYKQLSKDTLFLVAFWGAILLSFSVAIIIIINSELDFCLRFECFSELIVIFKFPIGLATAGMSLAGLRALVFRSQQMSIQINEIIKNNTFTNFITHKTEFLKLLTSIEKELPLTFHNKDSLYSKIFWRNSPTNLEFEASRYTETKETYIESLIYQYDKECLGHIAKLSVSSKTKNLSPGDLIELLETFMNIAMMMNIEFEKTEIMSKPYSYKYRPDNKMISNTNQLYLLENVFKAIVRFCSIEQRDFEYTNPIEPKGFSTLLNDLYKTNQRTGVEV